LKRKAFQRVCEKEVKDNGKGCGGFEGVFEK
jgi:hypothetical protein